MADDRTAEIIRLFGSEVATPDLVAEGLRLVKAFMQINDPVVRDALLVFAERIAKSRAVHR